MPTYRVAAIFFLLPLLFLGLFLPLFLFAAEDVCDPASEAGKGIVTNDCVVCISDAQGKKKPVGAQCLVSEGGSNTKANCLADASVFAGQCKVTYKTPDGKTLTAMESNKPSPGQTPPATTADLKKIYDGLVGEGSQAYVPKEFNTGPESTWLGEIDKAFAAEPTSPVKLEPQTPSAADELQRIAGPYSNPYFDPTKGTFESPPPTSLTPGVSEDFERLMQPNVSDNLSEPNLFEKPLSTDTFEFSDKAPEDSPKCEGFSCAWEQVTNCVDNLGGCARDLLAKVNPFDIEAQAAPLDPKARDSLIEAAGVLCKVHDCNAEDFAQAIGGVCAKESRCDPMMQHPGSKYQGLGQLDRYATEQAYNALIEARDSGKLTPAEVQKLEGILQKTEAWINNSSGAKDPRFDPVSGAYLLAARNAQLPPDLQSASPVSAIQEMAPNDPLTQAKLHQLTQLAPSIHLEGEKFGQIYDWDKPLNQSQVDALSNNGLKGVTTVQQALDRMDTFRDRWGQLSSYSKQLPEGVTWVSQVVNPPIEYTPPETAAHRLAQDLDRPNYAPPIRVASIESVAYEPAGYTPTAPTLVAIYVPEGEPPFLEQPAPVQTSYTPDLTVQGTWGGLPELTRAAYDVTTLQKDTTFTSIPSASFEDFGAIESVIQSPSLVPSASFGDFQQLDATIEAKSLTSEPIASYEAPPATKTWTELLDEQGRNVKEGFIDPVSKSLTAVHQYLTDPLGIRSEADRFAAEFRQSWEQRGVPASAPLQITVTPLFSGATDADLAMELPAPTLFAENQIPMPESFVQTGEEITQQVFASADVEDKIPVPESFAQSGEDITAQITAQNEQPKEIQVSDETKQMLVEVDGKADAKFDEPPAPLTETKQVAEEVVRPSDEKKLAELQRRADTVKARTANIARIVTNPANADVPRLGREVSAAPGDLAALDRARADALKSGVITREESARITAASGELRKVVSGLAENQKYYTEYYQDNVRARLATSQDTLGPSARTALANAARIEAAIPEEAPTRTVTKPLTTIVASSDYIPTGPGYYSATPAFSTRGPFSMFAYSGTQSELNFADLSGGQEDGLRVERVVLRANERVDEPRPFGPSPVDEGGFTEIGWSRTSYETPAITQPTNIMTEAMPLPSEGPISEVSAGIEHVPPYEQFDSIFDLPASQIPSGIYQGGELGDNVRIEVSPSGVAVRDRGVDSESWIPRDRLADTTLAELVRDTQVSNESLPPKQETLPGLSSSLTDYIDYEAGIDIRPDDWSRLTLSEDDIPETRSIPAYTPEELIAQQVGPAQPAPVDVSDIEPTRATPPSSVTGISQVSLPSACSGSSAADCVESLGGNWSTERARIASVIGCSAGTAACNTQILNTIRERGSLPTIIPLPPSRPSENNPYATAVNYKGDSIVNFLKAAGEPNDYASRSTLARRYGIQNYSGTAAQNIQLLGILRATIR